MLPNERDKFSTDSVIIWISKAHGQKQKKDSNI